MDSPLATNAVRAPAGLVSPVVRLCLASDHYRIAIRVWDGGDQMPVRKNAGPDSECGRSLLLVESLSTEWGIMPESRRQSGLGRVCPKGQCDRAVIVPDWTFPVGADSGSMRLAA